ncbi:MAG: DUF1634 domain-containing protein [Nitrospirota bacterium]
MNSGTGVKQRGQIEKLLGTLLITGVVLAAAIVLIGGISYLIKYGAIRQNYSVFRGEPAVLRRLGEIFRLAWSLESRGIIQFGLLVLIATPIARVAFSFAAFVRDRDWMYSAFTLLVLLVLMYSLVGR